MSVLNKTVALQRVLFVALLILAVGWLPGSVQASSDMGDTINVAGRQRMLIQKMSKEILLIAADIDAATNTGELKKTAELFDTSLKGLQDFGHKEIGDQLKVVGGLWDAFHQHVAAVLGGQVGADVLAKVAAENMPLLKNMNQVVMMYTKVAGSTMSQDLADTINVAGRQRMLIQKMSKEALLVFLKIDADANAGELKKSAELFDTTLKGLKSYDNAEIDAQLKLVAGLWDKFHAHIHGIVSGKASKELLQNVSAENMPLLKNMNMAVQMYAKLVK